MIWTNLIKRNSTSIASWIVLAVKFLKITMILQKSMNLSQSTTPKSKGNTNISNNTRLSTKKKKKTILSIAPTKPLLSVPKDRRNLQGREHRILKALFIDSLRIPGFYKWWILLRGGKPIWLGNVFMEFIAKIFSRRVDYNKIDLAFWHICIIWLYFKINFWSQIGKVELNIIPKSDNNIIFWTKLISKK